MMMSNYRLLCVLLTLALCGCSSVDSPDGRNTVRPVYVPVHKLADDYKSRLVKVTAQYRETVSCERNQRGFGLLLDDGSNIATAMHVVDPKSCTRVGPILVEDCTTGKQWDATVLATEAKSDIAIVQTSAERLVEGNTEILDGDTPLDYSIWLLGFDGKCGAKRVGPYQRSASNGTFIIDGEISGGSSGGVFFSDRGIVGLALRSINGGAQSAGVSVSAIAQLVESTGSAELFLSESQNVPPESKEAVRERLVGVIGSYVFESKQVFEFFEKGWSTRNNLRQIVPTYNNAYSQFDSEKQLIAPYVEKYWPENAADAFQVVSKVESTHALVRDLNTEINRIADRDIPTKEELADRLTPLGGSVADLEKQYEALLEQIND